MSTQLDDRSLAIGILTSNRTSYSVRRLMEEGRRRGHRMRALEPMNFSILLEKGNPALLYRSKPLPIYDAVIPRVSAKSTPFGAAVVRQFEQLGVFCVNSSDAILAARDKFRAAQTLIRRGIPMPATAFVAQSEAVPGALERLGGAPVVLKLIEGSQGIGVTLAERAETALAIADMLDQVSQKALLQQFVAESRGRDVRAFVVDGRVVAAMRRVAEGDEFRSNIHRGGHAHSIELPELYRKTAVKAAQVLGLGVAGIDMLEGHESPFLIEVNSSPGLEGIEGCTGVDVAGAVLDYVERACHMPELDVRQRLRMATGHSVVELTVAKKSSLAGKAIRDTVLMHPRIRVLTVSRGEHTLPLPDEGHVLEAGDEVMVFGESKLLRGLMPQRGRRRKRGSAADGSPTGSGSDGQPGPG